MDDCYSGGHIVGDHIHTDITTFNIKELQQNGLGTVSNRLVRGLNMFYWAQIPSLLLQ